MQAALAIIAGIFQLLIMFFQKKMEKDVEKKKKLEDAGNEIKDGIKRRDPSRITSGFDHAKRV